MIKLGQVLICKNNQPLEGNTIAPPLTVDEKYTAKEVLICDCGQDHIDVGLKSKYNFITCYKSKTELPRGTKIHWCHPSRFEQQ